MIFDGVTSTIIIQDEFSVGIEQIYSKWKEWVLKEDNAKYLQAFYVVNLNDPAYILINGWEIKGIDRKNIKGRFL